MSKNNLYEYLINCEFFNKERKDQFDILSKFVKNEFDCNKNYDGVALTFYRNELFNHSKNEYYWLGPIRINNIKKSKSFERIMNILCKDLTKYGYCRVIFDDYPRLSYVQYLNAPGDFRIIKNNIKNKIPIKEYFNYYVENNPTVSYNIDKELAKKACEICYYVLFHHDKKSKKIYAENDPVYIIEVMYNTLKNRYNIIWDKKKCMLYNDNPSLKKYNNINCEKRNQLYYGNIICPWTVIRFVAWADKVFKQNKFLKY